MSECKIIQTKDKHDDRFRHVGIYEVNEQNNVVLTYLGKYRVEVTQQGDSVPEVVASLLLADAVRKAGG